MVVRLHSALLVSSSLSLHALVRILSRRLVNSALDSASLLAWNSSVTSSLVDLALVALLISSHRRLVDLLVSIVALVASSHHLVGSSTSSWVLIPHASSVWWCLGRILLAHLVLVVVLIILLGCWLRLSLHVVAFVWIPSLSCSTTTASPVVHSSCCSSIVGLIIRVSCSGASWLLVLLWGWHPLGVALVV